jgi:hypothetical protein
MIRRASSVLSVLCARTLFRAKLAKTAMEPYTRIRVVADDPIPIKSYKGAGTSVGWDGQGMADKEGV